MRINSLREFSDSELERELHAAQRAVEDCSLSSFVDIADRHRNKVIGEIWRRRRMAAKPDGLVTLGELLEAIERTR